MVGNPCLPSVERINEAVRLWMKLDCHVHAGLETAVLHHQAVVGDQ